MLIQKSSFPAIGDVTSIRLNSGEEIVGKVVATDANSITITKPIVLAVQMMQRAPNLPPEAAIQFAPFMVGAEEADSFKFSLDRLTVSPLKAREDIKMNYLKATTGLEIPAGPGLLKV